MKKVIGYTIMASPVLIAFGGLIYTQGIKAIIAMGLVLGAAAIIALGIWIANE